MDFLENKVAYGIIVILVVLYIQSIRINLSPKLSKILNTNLFRLIALSVIAYLATRDVAIAIILGVGFVIGFIFLQKNKLVETFDDLFNGAKNVNKLNQPGVINNNRCDPENEKTNYKFNKLNCDAYSDETREYNL